MPSGDRRSLRLVAMAVILILVLVVIRRLDSESEGERRIEKGPAVDRIAEASVAWMQYSEDGLQLRIVATANRCPQVLLGHALIEPAERELVDPAFPAASCTVPVIPGDVVKFGKRRFEIPGDITRIVVLADPACEVTACDPDSFGRLAQAAAATDPSLVVIAGDLVADSQTCYSQPGCMPPTDDRWATWKLRFFDPGAPLFEHSIVAFARGRSHSCAGDKYEGWGHLVAPGWYPSSVMCRPVDPTIEVDLGSGSKMYVIDATATPPPKDVPSWIVTGTETLPGDLDVGDFRSRLWIRPGETARYDADRGDGVAEMLVGPATGDHAVFWVIDRDDECWRARLHDVAGALGDSTGCLPS